MRLLLSRGAAASCHDDATGETCLMRAAMNGHVEAVEKLLASGAPWNALDRRGLCAGDHALRHGFQDIVDKLVNAGWRPVCATVTSLAMSMLMLHVVGGVVLGAWR